MRPPAPQCLTSRTRVQIMQRREGEGHPNFSMHHVWTFQGAND